MSDKKLFPVSFTKRVIAFAIDIFIVCVIRTILIQLLVMQWLQKYVMDFINGFQFVFGKIVKFSDFNEIHMRFFLQSKLYPRLLIFIIIILSVSFIYNLLTLYKWSATLGQKFLGFYIVSKNNRKMSHLQVIARSFLAVLPWYAIFVLFNYQMIALTGVISIIPQKIFIISLGFGLLIWYDMFFYTKDKLLMHDLISQTKAVSTTEAPANLLEKILKSFDDVVPAIKQLVQKTLKKIKKPQSKNKKAKK